MKKRDRFNKACGPCAFLLFPYELTKITAADLKGSSASPLLQVS